MYVSKQSEFNSWNRMCDAFKRTFIREVNKTEALEIMKKHVQESGDSIVAYFDKKVRLCRPLKLTFSEIKDEVVPGLRSKEIAVSVAAATHQDEDELFAELENLNRRLRNLNKDRQMERKVDTWSWADNSSSTKLAKEYAVDTRNVKCYNCQRSGHFTRTCPKPKGELTCGKCKQKGHGTKDCTKPVPLSTGSINLINTSGRESPAKFITVLAINGKPFTAMIDPGSSDCTMKSSIMLLEDFTLVRGPSEFRGFGPNSVVKSDGLVRIELKVDAAHYG